MKIVVNGVVLTLQENDEVTAMRHPCEDCGGHEEFEVVRNNKTVANFGAYLYLISKKKELFGDVVMGRDPKSLQIIPFL